MEHDIDSEREACPAEATLGRDIDPAKTTRPGAIDRAIYY